MSTFDHFVGTRPVSDQHAFDVPALTAWMQGHVQGFAGPLQVEMFKGGQSNPTYKLITPGRSYVMRSKPGPVAKLLPSAHAIEREFRVMKGLAGTDVPVPHMYALCEDESIIGRAFYVMEFMAGRVLWDQTLPGMDEAGRAAIYDEMNRVIAALGIPDEDSYIRLYCERTGITTPEALRADWNFYMAYNLFRIAAILQGIAKRVEAGTASSAQAATSGAGARPMAELAWDFAQRA